MKTKLTFLTLAIVALLGAGMLMAFKQSETNKRYMHMNVSHDKIIVIDENNKIESITEIDKKLGAYLQQINLEMNNISLKGFKLINSSQVTHFDGVKFTIYTFEK
jgi:hypothetical protein